MLKYAIAAEEPVAIRYPRGEACDLWKDQRAPIQKGCAEVLAEGTYAALFAIGSMVETAWQVRKKLAEKGLSTQQKDQLMQCIIQIEPIFKKTELSNEDIEIYHYYNTIFHNTIIQGSDNIAIVQALSKNNQLPMASAQALTYDKNNPLSEIRRLHHAHIQHCAIFNALKNRDSARAESLMREHSHVVTLGDMMRSIFNSHAHS